MSCRVSKSVKLDLGHLFPSPRLKECHAIAGQLVKIPCNFSAIFAFSQRVNQKRVKWKSRDNQPTIPPKMEFNGKKDVVDPEVRAYVSSLVTAVSMQTFVLWKTTDRRV